MDRQPMNANEINIAIENRLFGDDLKPRTDSEHVDAVVSFHRAKYDEALTGYPDHLMPMTIGQKAILAGFGENMRAYCMWPWDKREGQPYQAEFEAYVATYRRPARDFCTDRNLLPVAMDKLAWDYDCFMARFEEICGAACEDGILSARQVLAMPLPEIYAMVLEAMDGR